MEFTESEKELIISLLMQRLYQTDNQLDVLRGNDYTATVSILEKDIKCIEDILKKL